ncbi:MAG TPA: hypothetical protein VGZ48_00870 [Candidatus Acidoferrales bacterium]|jgi:hypothetical protein|nr:hypothetical protein [Candidatus Acidoferrales bacterium]
MAIDDRNLLDVLHFELDFLLKGGYGSSPREPWRCPLIFEDSPSCMNYDTKDHPSPCGECVLMPLVSAADREKMIPCRHIPLSPNGDTLASLYRYASQQEIENVMRSWLENTIDRLEGTPIQDCTHSQPECTQCERNEPRENAGMSRPVHENAAAKRKGTASFDLHYPKCANPACPAAFHWLAGGKFFRFRVSDEDGTAKNSVGHSRHVKHYWLCDHCAPIYFLSYEEPQGVVVRPLWAELPAVEVLKRMSAA